MKNKNTGFTIVEVLLVTVILGILVTIGLPHMWSYQAKARDAVRNTSIAQIYRSVVTADSIEEDGSYAHDNPSIQALVDKDEIDFDGSDSVYCYVYGYKAKEFFIVVRSEANKGDYLVNGTPQGRTAFENSVALQSDMSACGPLATPTALEDYAVFYIE